MKIIILILMLAATAVFGQTYTNGVFTFVDGQSSYELSTPKGLQPLVKGRTYDVDRAVYYINTTNNSATLQFSAGVTARVETNSQFIISSLFQEIQNTNNEPQLAHFGSHTVSTTLMSGDASFVCSDADSNSECVVSTPLVDIELQKGKFFVHCNERIMVLYVIEGSAKVNHGRKAETVVAGKASIVTPIDIGILEEKYAFSASKMDANTLKKLSSKLEPLSLIPTHLIFIRINGKTVGVNIN